MTNEQLKRRHKASFVLTAIGIIEILIIVVGFAFCVVGDNEEITNLLWR